MRWHLLFVMIMSGLVGLIIGQHYDMESRLAESRRRVRVEQRVFERQVQLIEVVRQQPETLSHPLIEDEE